MLKAKLHENDKCGHWPLLKQVPKSPNLKTNLIYWLCQCDCNEKITKIIDDNKFYKCVLKNPIPLSHNDVDVEECTYEELKTIPSSRGMGALGSSGK